MTVVNPKSISGITSITTPSGADDLLTIHNNSGAERFRVDGSGNTRITSGIVTTISIGAVSSVGAISGDVSIADKIVHTGDTNTAIRFPDADTVTVETAGSERARVDSNGIFLVGKNSSYGSGKTQLHNTSQYVLDVATWAADATGPTVDFYKSRNATPGGATVVQSGDVVGRLRFLCNDGTNSITAAQITVESDGTPGTNDMPGRIVFATTADGASSSTERLRINSVGKVGINSTAPDGMLAIEHTSAAPNLTMRNHPSAGVYTNLYGMELRHAYGSVKHGALIHTQEAHDTRRALDVSDSNGIFATFVNHKVGINTTVPSAGHLMVESNGAYSLVSKSINGNGGYHVFTGQANNGTATSYITHNGRGYFEDGVQFDSSGETLSSYEEGTWTPTNSIGLTLTNENPAYYLKVGKMVMVQFDISWSGASDTAQCGLIQSLPFTSENTATHYSQGALPHISNNNNLDLDTSLDDLLLYIAPNEARIDVFSFSVNNIAARSSLVGRRIRHTMFYKAAS